MSVLDYGCFRICDLTEGGDLQKRARTLENNFSQNGRMMAPFLEYLYVPLDRSCDEKDRISVWNRCVRQDVYIGDIAGQQFAAS